MLERIHLILHQRDQRRHHDADTVAQQGRNLVAQRLAAAGRHQHQCIAARHNVLDDGLLRAAKRGVAECVAKDLLGGALTHELSDPVKVRKLNPIGKIQGCSCAADGMI